MENTQKIQQQVTELFAQMEKQYPGVAEGVRVLGMSYQEYLSILQSSQPTSSISTNTVLLPIEK